MRVLRMGWYASALCCTLQIAACKDDKGAVPDDTGAPDTGCVVLDDGNCVTETFTNPPELEPDADGIYQLRFGPSEVEIDGQTQCVRSFNGSFPAPTIDVPARSGTDQRKIRVNLINEFTEHDYESLDGGACTCTDEMGEACDPHEHDGCDMDDDGHTCTCLDEDGETCEHVYDFNTTNIHFHGTHVEPDAATGGGCTPDGALRCRDCDSDTCDGDSSDDDCYYSDDVLSVIGPGQGNQYLLDLDEDGTHHEGISWYHPHIHGTTAIQVAGGSAGALIIRGSLDEVDGVADARERVLVFSTPPVSDGGFTPLADGLACTEDTLTFNDFSIINGVSPQLNVINGLRQPRMLTAPGQVERWRFVHAGFLDEVFLGLRRGEDSNCSSWTDDALPMEQIARDNITLTEPYDSNYLFMSPGYRIETILGGEGALQDGDTWCLVAYRLLQDDTSGGPPVELPVPLDEDDVDHLLSDGDLVAILNVSAELGEASETTPPTPAALAAVAPSTTLDGVSAEDRCADAAAVDDPEDIDQVVVMEVGFWTFDDPDPCNCGEFNINCDNYADVDRAQYPWDRDLPLGTIQHWRVASSKDGHTFHIHTNPFLACPEDNLFDPIPFPHWRDTYLVNLARKVDLITQYNRFTGGFVLHCHKLVHEDEGMMERIRVCDPSVDPTCGDYAWDACAPGDLSCAQHLASTECALEATNDVEAAACVASLAGPEGVCGLNACASDDDCPPGSTCEDYVCSGP